MTSRLCDYLTNYGEVFCVEVPLKVFSGTANRPLAEAVATALEIELGNISVSRFSDGEIRVQIQENVRGADCFLIQPTCPPVNENLMELLVMIDAFKRASAERIVAVMPYYGYARQDRKIHPREPISAKLVADLLNVAGADRVFSIDLHAGQIQGFFDIPVDHVPAGPILADYALSQGWGNDETVVVSPDVGGMDRATRFARRLHAGLAIVVKRRPEAQQAEVLEVIGEVEGKRAILIDDIVDTGGSLAKAAEELLKRGASEIYACCTHAVLSGSAVQRIQESPIKQLIVTDTIPISPEKQTPKLTRLTVAPLLAQVIRQIHEHQSVSQIIAGLW